AHDPPRRAAGIGRRDPRAARGGARQRGCRGAAGEPPRHHHLRARVRRLGLSARDDGTRARGAAARAGGSASGPVSRRRRAVIALLAPARTMPSGMSRHPEHDALHLAELLDFRPDRGEIRLHEQRVLILSAAALGLLRKELIETFGAGVARRLLLRLGYADGYHDAVNLRARAAWTTPADGLRAGVVLQTLEGIARVEITRVDVEAGRFEAEYVWRNSYEVQQHLHHYGAAAEPVCWSLVGYASGYASACLGEEVYFREVACAAQGASRCRVLGRLAPAWGAELDALRADFQGVDLREEMDRLSAAVRRQARELARRERLLERRARELNLPRDRVARHARSRRFLAPRAPLQEALEPPARVAPLDTAALVPGPGA